MKLVLAALACLMAAIAFSVETNVELAHRTPSGDAPAAAARTGDRATAPTSRMADARTDRAPRETILRRLTALDDTGLLARLGEDDVALDDDVIVEDGASEDAEPVSDDEIAYGTVSGTLVDSSGAAIVDGWVQLMPNGCDACSPTDAQVEPDGHFTVSVEPGTWDVIARAEGYRGAAERSVVVEAEAEVSGITLTLEKGLSVSGRVVADGEPVIGATVYLEGNGYRLSTTASGEDAEFEFTGLVAGRYHVTAYEVGWGGDAREVTAGDTATLALRSSTLHGTVVDASGSPVAEARVMVRVDPQHSEGEDHDPFGTLESVGGDYFDGCGESCDTVFTDQDGAFELDVPEAATLSLGATDDANGRAQLDDVSPSSATIVLRLRPPRETRVRVVMDAPAPSEDGDEAASGGDGEAPASMDRPDALVAYSEGLFAYSGAEERDVDADGVATILSWDGIPVTVEEPDGAHVVPMGPLPHEVTIAPASDEDHVQLAASPRIKERLRAPDLVGGTW